MPNVQITSFLMALTLSVSASSSPADPTIPLSDNLQHIVHGECSKAPEIISPEVVFAIIEHESNFIEDAVNVNDNGSVDYGYGQINECNWVWLAEEGIDVFTPEDNLRAIVLILSIYAEKGYSLDEVLAAYARGESGMLAGNGFWFADEIRSIMLQQALKRDEDRSKKRIQWLVTKNWPIHRVWILGVK